MTIADQNERILTRYEDVEDLALIHQAIKENVINEASNCTQCMILLHLQDYKGIRTNLSDVQEVSLTAYPTLPEITVDKRNGGLVTVDAYNRNHRGTITELWQLNTPMQKEKVFMTKSQSGYQSGYKYIAGGKMYSYQLDIPIFFPNIPSEDFAEDSLFIYLHEAILDAVDALYASKNTPKDREETIRRVSSQEFITNLVEFSRNFLQDTRNVQKGIKIIER